MPSRKPRTNGVKLGPSERQNEAPPRRAHESEKPGYVLRRDLKEIRDSRGFSIDDVALQAGVSRGTVMNAEAGRMVNNETRCRLAQFYRIERWKMLDDTVLPPAMPQGILSWAIAETGPVMTASNGIQWRVCELNHQFVQGLKRRGKMYDLSPFSHNAQAWRRMQTCLSRHCAVCNRIGDHPNIARSYDVFPEEDNRAIWWVLDEWLDGITLQHRLDRGRLDQDELIACMRDISAGLEALHSVGVIRRELTPQFIYLVPDRAVLTDFELAKLLDGSPTVQPNGRWPAEDPYRAPEVRDSETAKPSWDLYSWAMILAHAASGRKPKGPDDAKRHIRDAHLPRDVEGFSLQCLGESKSRPSDFSALQSWFR